MDMKKFEYLELNESLPASEFKLNKLGVDGWELVSHCVLRCDGINHYYVFKRETINK